MLFRLKRLIANSLRISRLATRWLRDVSCGSYGPVSKQWSGVAHHRSMPATVTQCTELSRPKALATNYLMHRFNMLGSGSRQWTRMSDVVVNRAYGRVSETLPNDYQPIDRHSARRDGFLFLASQRASLGLYDTIRFNRVDIGSSSLNLIALVALVLAGFVSAATVNGVFFLMAVTITLPRPSFISLLPERSRSCLACLLS